MTEISLGLLIVAAATFAYRLVVGPTLADRVTALNGLLLAGMGGIAVQASSTGTGAFLPTLVAITLVGPISNGMIARYIEERAK
jgi:multicomponent Na+:H+ antiporter subunit F